MERLGDLRLGIDTIDERIVNLLADRMAIVKQIQVIKYKNNIASFDKQRFNEILRERSKTGEGLKLSSEYIRRIFKIIHEESLDQMAKCIRGTI